MLSYIEKKWCEKLDRVFDEQERKGFIPVEQFSNNYYYMCEVY